MSSITHSSSSLLTSSISLFSSWGGEFQGDYELRLKCHQKRKKKSQRLGISKRDFPPALLRRQQQQQDILPFFAFLCPPSNITTQTRSLRLENTARLLLIQIGPRFSPKRAIYTKYKRQNAIESPRPPHKLTPGRQKPISNLCR